MEWKESSLDSHEEARLLFTLIGYLIRERALTRVEIEVCLNRQIDVMMNYLDDGYEKYVMRIMFIIKVIMIRVNSHVFEAFCFTLWALIHYYPRSYLCSLLQSSSSSSSSSFSPTTTTTSLPPAQYLLVAITLTDPNANTRRAGAAVLQEAIGRGIWGLEDGTGELVSEFLCDETVRNHEIM